MPGGWLFACTLDDLHARPLRPARVGGHDLLIVGDGERVHAVERACPHEQADLSEGHCRDGRLHCPRHKAFFDLLGDGRISPGWVSRPLRRYPVRIVGRSVLVDLPGGA
ncbi:Rieske (2Fe-2S) protein [uncultured Enterovirga sp.]|uniref:Rieske (2Fe-2S) protein n=1 Tax=uncultured Enterovirga sp. TaxID=2026352 RepID=UPI0035CAB71A